MRSIASLKNLALIALSAATALACSASDESALIYEESVAPAPVLSGEEREAEFQRLLDAPLSEDEMIAVEGRLIEMGINMSEVTFSGRVVALGDAYLEADQLLGAALEPEGEVQKGRTLATTVNTVQFQENGANFITAPVVYSQIFNGNYQFMRPDIQNVAIVIPNGSAHNFLVTAFQQAAALVVNAANDCLTNIAVIRQADFDALSLAEKNAMKPIFVRYGARATVCRLGGATTRACSLFPRLETRDFDFNLSSTRLVPGTRIGVVSSFIADASANNVAVLTHELLHTLGLAHPFDSAVAVTVVGTQGSSFTSSIMQNFCTPGQGCLFTATPSADDIDTIDTLFSPQGNQGCGYRPGLKTIAAN